MEHDGIFIRAGNFAQLLEAVGLIAFSADLIEGPLDVFRAERLAVMPFYAFMQMKRQRQAVVGELPAFRQIADDLVGNCLLDQPVENILIGDHTPVVDF